MDMKEQKKQDQEFFEKRMKESERRPGMEIRRRHRRRVNVWLVIGVIVLILLLLLWLTWADLLGDTDVGNFIEVAH